MEPYLSAGAALRQALEEEQPLQIVGVINAYAARLAERSGFRALYLSGSGVAAASLGVPDLGIITLDDVLIDARRITDASGLPLLVDVDTGFGSAFNIARTVKSLIKVGAAGLHIEDQVSAKRCGHRPGKAIVPLAEMIDRIKAAADARSDPNFVIMARTDALASEGLNGVIERILACREAGADMAFPEAIGDLQSYRAIAEAVGIPILANLTEFGLTPLFSVEELRRAGVALALYPLTAFRVMSAAAMETYQTLRREGSQRSVLSRMQTRAELYDFLDYYAHERKLDALFAKEETL